MAKKFFPSSSLYAQMLALFMVLLVPVQVIGGGILLHSAQTVRQNSLEKSERALVAATDRLSSQIDAIYQRAYTWLQNRNSNLRQPFNSPAQGSLSQQWINLRDIMKELSWFIISSDVIQEIHLFYPTLGFSVSSNEYRVLQEDDYAQYLATFPESSAPLLRLEQEQPCMTLLYPSILPSVSEAIILMRIQLSTETLLNSIEEKMFVGSGMLFFDGKYIADSESTLLQFADSIQPGIEVLRTKNGTYQILSSTDALYGFTLVNLIPTSALNATSQALSMLFIVYAFLGIALLVAYAVIMRHIVYYPMRNLLKGYAAIQTGTLDVHVDSKGPGEFRRLIDGFNQMTTHLNHAMQTIYEQKIYTQQIELKQLQAQINPHFLYNTFFMLERLVDDEDTAAARATCRYLGSYFQYITYSGEQIALIQDEYTHAMNYLMLQKLRYEDRLELDIAPIPACAVAQKVPRLIFQPILENVFAHGVKYMGGKMVVRIRFAVEDALHIMFENSAVEAPAKALALDLDGESRQDKITGLVNIHRRIRLRFGAPYGLRLEQSPLGGLQVTIVLPYPVEKGV